MHCHAFQVQSFYNYGPLTVALAVNYMDRFLSRHHLPVSLWLYCLALFSSNSVFFKCFLNLVLSIMGIGYQFREIKRAIVCLRFVQEDKDWMLQLLSVACVSLAAKMEESEVPILLDLQVNCLGGRLLEGTVELSLLMMD